MAKDEMGYVKKVNPEESNNDKDNKQSSDTEHQPTNDSSSQKPDAPSSGDGKQETSLDKKSGEQPGEGKEAALKKEAKSALADTDTRSAGARANAGGEDVVKGVKAQDAKGKTPTPTDAVKGAKDTAKGAKRAAQTADVAAKATIGYQMLNMMKMAMMMMLNFLTNIGSSVSAAAGALMAFVQGIINAVSTAVGAVAGALSAAVSAVGGFLGIGGVASTIVVATGVATAGLTLSVGILSFVGGVTNDPSLYDAMVEDCSVSVQNVVDMTEIGDLGALELEHAKQVYSIYKTYGLTDNQIAGMLGNWSVESGVDPTGVEGIYNEKYQIGPRKQQALENHHSYTQELFDMYAESGVGLNHEQYRSKVDKLFYPGLGMPQFTSGDRIIRPAESLGKNWYEMDFQMAFILAMGTDATTGRKGGSNFFNVFKSETADYSPGQAALYFLEFYEGVPSDRNASRRVQSADSWAMQLKNWEIDTAYAQSVMAMASQLGVVATDGAIADAMSRCVKTGFYDNSSLAAAATSYAYPTTDEGRGNDGTPLFQRVYENVWGTRYYNGAPMQSCDVGVSTAVRWSGSDITYPAYSTSSQFSYLAASPKWELVGRGSDLTVADLLPGDVAILNGHTWLYVGNEIIVQIHGAKAKPGSNSVSASYNERSPGAGTDATYYITKNGGNDPFHGKMYYIYRLVNPDNSDKYKDSGSGS